jgi:hypothetical protein
MSRYADDDWRPFTGPYTKALQMRAMVEDIQARREEREMRRQRFAEEIEGLRRRRASEDFMTRMLLEEQGADEAGPHDRALDSALDSALGPVEPESRRSIMRTPVGDFRMPSRADKRRRAHEAARQAGIAKGIEQQATEEIMDPYEDVGLPAELGGGTARVPKKGKADLLLKIQDALQKRNPKLEISYSDNDRGDRTYFGTNPQTGEVKELRTIKGAAKTKTVSERSQGLSGSDTQRLRSEATDEAIEAMRRDHPEGLETAEWRAAIKRGMDPSSAASQALFGYPEQYHKDITSTAEFKQKFNRIYAEKLRGAKGGGKVGTTPTSKQASPYKVGDVVMHGGRKLKITKIYPDRTFDYEEVR